MYPIQLPFRSPDDLHSRLKFSYLKKGNWLDAVEHCRQMDTFLWSASSHEELTSVLLKDRYQHAIRTSILIQQVTFLGIKQSMVSNTCVPLKVLGNPRNVFRKISNSKSEKLMKMLITCNLKIYCVLNF